jgi:hypothetical protein
MAAPPEPLYRTLNILILFAEKKLEKAQKKLAVAQEEDRFSIEVRDCAIDVRLAQVSLDALKASFQVERERVINSIEPAGPSNPTPEMVWEMVADSEVEDPDLPPAPFPALKDLEILDKKAMMGVPWLKAICRAIEDPKGEGKAYCSINHCLSSTYTEVTEDGKMLYEDAPAEIAIRNKTTGEIEVWTLGEDGVARNFFFPGEIHITSKSGPTMHLTGRFFVIGHHSIDEVSADVFHHL